MCGSVRIRGWVSWECDFTLSCVGKMGKLEIEIINRPTSPIYYVFSPDFNVIWKPTASFLKTKISRSILF